MAFYSVISVFSFAGASVRGGEEAKNWINAQALMIMSSKEI